MAITAPCAFVDPWAAAVIGAIAGGLVVVGVFFWENAASTIRSARFPSTASTASGALISVGIFATGKYGAGWNGVVREAWSKQYGSDGVRGMLYGDFSQFIMQLINAATVLVFGFVMAYVWFKISNLITPIRVPKEIEIEGLDGPEMGVLGYPDFQLHSSQKMSE